MRPTLLRRGRTLHLYFGVLISPAILFFAVTGALQTFSLHETSRGSSYKPPQWVVVLAQIHKKQTTHVPQHKAPGTPQTASQPNGPAQHEAVLHGVATARHPIYLRLFFLLVSVGLVTSTATGLWMAYRHHSNKRLVSLLLVLGVVLPVLFLFV